MDIIINGKKIDYQIEQEKNIGEILGFLEAECEKAEMTITGIRADGIGFPADKLDSFFTKSTNSVSKIELTTISGKDVLVILRDLGNRFTSSVALLQEIPIQLQTGKDLTVLKTINTFSQDLQNFYQAIPLLSITGLPVEKTMINGFTLASYPSLLSPILTELLCALEKKDTVLVGDLSEYELAPKIEMLGALLSTL